MERVGEGVYWNLGEGSRIGPGETDKIFGIIERTDQNLESIGFTRQQIEEMKRTWHKPIMRDHAPWVVANSPTALS